MIEYRAKQKQSHDTKLQTNKYWYYELGIHNKVKDVNIKNQTYYFFDYIIDIENFHPSNIKIDKKSYKNILIYYIGYMDNQIICKNW